MSDKFQEFWQANFSDCLPVSYLFKSELNDLWFRIHSLPESKRYAENEEETQEILRRQKILFEDVIGEDDECFIVCLHYEKSPVEIYGNKFLQIVKLLTQESKPIPLQLIEDDAKQNEVYRVAFGKLKIEFSELKEILIAIADDEIHYLFILNPKSKRIFAPYDGGVDIILESSGKRDEFKERYKDWLSSREDGL
jgi:hypothetical protein